MAKKSLKLKLEASHSDGSISTGPAYSSNVPGEYEESVKACSQLIPRDKMLKYQAQTAMLNGHGSAAVYGKGYKH